MKTFERSFFRTKIAEQQVQVSIHTIFLQKRRMRIHHEYAQAIIFWFLWLSFFKICKAKKKYIDRRT